MPIGIYGTVPHILTNKNVDNKKAAVKDCVKNGLKGTKNLLIGEAAVLGGGAAATVAVNKLAPNFSAGVKEGLSAAKSFYGSMLEAITVGAGENATNLKEVIKNTGIVDGIKAIPAPLKGALVAAVTILPGVLTYIGAKTIANGAALEAKHETK